MPAQMARLRSRAVSRLQPADVTCGTECWRSRIVVSQPKGKGLDYGLSHGPVAGDASAPIDVDRADAVKQVGRQFDRQRLVRLAVTGGTQGVDRYGWRLGS